MVIERCRLLDLDGPDADGQRVRVDRRVPTLAPQLDREVVEVALARVAGDVRRPS
jgi:hypothetical protein